jgi:hypothetical protein
MWIHHPEAGKPSGQLLLHKTQHKDIIKLAKSIKANPHGASKLWIVAVICDQGTANTTPSTLA